MIQRFFHPVGQGAFYSERHEYQGSTLNIVYDCGTEYMNRRKKGIRGVVTQSFRKQDVIHILFISHFDYDHISLIELLKNTVNRIERVVIPFLNKKETIFLANVYKALGEARLAELVSDPETFFGEGTHVIQVQLSTEEGNGEKATIRLSESTPKEIPSGTPLSLENYGDWVFVPYNHLNEERGKDFRDKLQEVGIDVGKLENPGYVLDKDRCQKIKGCYKKIDGGINQNSMFLYSGPSKGEGVSIYFWVGGISWYHNHLCGCLYDHYFDSDRVACLYTGDGDLNKVDVGAVYGKYWEFIGTIQIPHHGSLPSFKDDVLKKRCLLCPISVGKNNSYGHPSQCVISRILFHRSCPILVTEDVCSTFVEVIEWSPRPISG
ncbi:hypothetical protein [uncultured Porphyromonas sp.]|uniref:hypothetical protein n=1 Tax=uncultured Porphyromonas sp. TaxID=159274 RepID=UPI0026365117|nr:hypothetical protein [uncultured Porphyromonas sp.]